MPTHARASRSTPSQAEIFEEQTYLRHGTELPQHPVVVSVGANTGLFTLFVTQQRPEAAALACEPVPDTLAALQGDLARHEVAGVTVSPHALGRAREAAVAFTLPPPAGQLHALPG